MIGGEDQGCSISSCTLVNGRKDMKDNQKTVKIEEQETKVIYDPVTFLESNGVQKLKAYHSTIPPTPPVTADTHENEEIAPLHFCSCFKQLYIGQEWLI